MTTPRHHLQAIRNHFEITLEYTGFLGGVKGEYQGVEPSTLDFHSLGTTITLTGSRAVVEASPDLIGSPPRPAFIVSSQQGQLVTKPAGHIALPFDPHGSRLLREAV